MDNNTSESRSYLKEKIKQLKAELNRVQKSSHNPTEREIGTFTWDLNSDTIHYDNAAKQILGINDIEKPISSRKFFRLIIPGKRDKLKQKFNEIVVQKEVFNLEFPISPRGGISKHIKKWGKVIYNEQSPVLISGAVMHLKPPDTDPISAFKDNRLFKKFLEHNLSGIYVLQNNKLIFTNNRLREIIGYSEHELKVDVTLNDLIHPSEEYYVHEDLKNILKSQSGTVENSYRIVHKSGELKYVEVYAMRMTYRGDPAIIGSVVDHTPQKLREKRLRQANQKYKVLAEQELYGIYMLINDEIVYINKKAANILGYKPNELTGKSLLKSNILPDKNLIKKNLRTRKENPEAKFHFETTAQTASGEIIDIEISSGPITFNSEQAILGVLKDITEKKQARRKLMDSESRNRAIISALPDMLVHLDRSGKYLNIHTPPNFDTIIQKNETIGKTLHEAVSKELANLFTDKIALTIEQNKLMTFEYEIPGTQEVRFREARMIPLDEDSVLTIIRDVTDYKKAEKKLQQNEKRLRMLLDQLPAIFWTTDRSLTFTSSRGSGLEKLGLSPGEIVGISLFEYFNTDDKSFLPIKKHYEALAGDSVKYTFEWNDQVYKTKIDPLRDINGNIIGTVALATDITQQEETKVELEQSLHEKDILLAEIHHRVKNNLSLINSIFGLQLLDTENNEVSQILRKNKNRIMAIASIHEMLYKAKNFSMVNLNKYVKKLCRFYNESDTPTHVSANVSELYLNIRQAIPLGLILNELVSNAIQHAYNSDSITVSIAKNNKNICMQVKDSGPGLKSDKKWHEYKTLGMTLIKRLKMQLEAELIYKYNEGSIFTLKFEKK